MLALTLERAMAMARAPAGLPAGIRVSDHVSLGVIARTFPLDQVRQVLAETGKASERERDLPAHVMVYYAIALALYEPVLPGPLHGFFGHSAVNHLVFGDPGRFSLPTMA